MSASDSRAFERLVLHAADGATATLCRHGAQVLGWQPAGAGRDLLFLSARSLECDGAAIRGGVPVVFPQFSGFGPLPKHGFARNRAWQLVATPAADRMALELVDDDATRALWPHAFRARLDIALASTTLTLALTVSNTGRDPLTFTAALHTYLAVRDIGAVRLHGLAGAHTLDATQGLEAGIEHAESIAFDGEFDRVYPGLAGELVLEDGDDTVTVLREGFADAVVWNPGAEKAAALSDLGAGDHRRFVCLEPAVFAPPQTLDAGAHWRGVQTLRHARRVSRSPADA